MFLVGFHPLGWHRPYAVREVDLIPSRNVGLAHSRNRQRDKFEAARRNTSILPDLCHESAGLSIGQRGMVLNLGDLGPRRKRVFEESFPARGIVTCPVVVNGRPSENVFDPASEARSQSGFRALRTRGVSIDATGSSPNTG